MKNSTETIGSSGKNLLSELTKKIVEHRGQSRKDFALLEEELLNMRSTINTILQNEKSPLWTGIIREQQIESSWDKTIQKAKDLNTQLASFMSESGLFYQAKDRADREYVNVGSVGVTQEGKSEFNACIAGLDKRIIPRGHCNESCTTARINIINGKSPEGKNDIVRVHYFSVNEFANQIYLFLIELGADKNEYRELVSISTKEQLESWINNNHNSIEQSTEIGKDDKGGEKVALLEYFENLSEYVGRLGKPHEDYTFQEIMSVKAEDKARAEEYYSSVSYFMNPDDKENKNTSAMLRRKLKFSRCSR